MTDSYILRGHTPVPCDDLMSWLRWYETADRQVADTIQDDVRVSTVFLGIDYNLGGEGPMLFETMVFRDGHGDERQRYSTWAEAEAGHKRWVLETFRPRPILQIEGDTHE
jgi:hypothetical protein